MDAADLMHVTLLGTGSADGWPNPFCTCANCADARDRGVIRGQTAALVDGRLLLDCGPEVPRAAARLGISLDPVRVLVLTHTHPDHLGPAALLYRRWAGRREVVTVVGPEAVIDTCRAWVGPDDPVQWQVMSPGAEVDVAGYHVHALAAQHDGADAGPSLVYEITDAAGVRLLYLTDTGPLPASTLDGLRGARAHLALIEETFGLVHDHGTDHLDLGSFAATVDRLRADDALNRTARVVAVHLSHDNPPLRELQHQLARCGAEVLDDGSELVVTAGGSPPLPTSPRRRSLVLGGARSGKSTYAEHLAGAEVPVRYVATMATPGDDVELASRIAEHQRRRPSHWSTVETNDVTTILREAAHDDVLLIDCFTLWLTARLDEAGWSSDGDWLGSADVLGKQVDELVNAWSTCPARLIGVSNEVGSGVVPATPSGRLFRDWQGRLNAELAQHCDDVVLLVAGRPFELVAHESHQGAE
jgi:adenosylcobinamide kinase / adenosylcobinamide-phosphate guanylyltransferase